MLTFAGVRLLKSSHSLIYNYSTFNGKHEKDLLFFCILDYFCFPRLIPLFSIFLTYVRPKYSSI